MSRTSMMLAAFAVALPTIASAQPVSAPDQAVDVGSNRIRIPGVPDPRAFVAATYARYQADPNVPPPDLAFAYSPRLKRLFDAYDSWARRHGDLVGALDFDWWTNAQDYSISHVVVTVRAAGRNLLSVTARFDNYDRHDSVRFLFVRQGGRWYLDDAVQGSGRGDDGWTLSALLRARP